VSAPVTLRTRRLILRPWGDDDLEPFAALNADPRVRQFYPSLLSRAESDDLVARIRARHAARGFGPWAVEQIGGAPFIGCIGLSEPSFSAPFTPCVEVGWSLAHAAWGQGYATEAARAALTFGFETLGLREVVAMTTPINLRSRRVMERLGMQRDPGDDFDHPSVPPGTPLSRHVLYRLRAPPPAR
jgi:RimJ/RimL family protein N-acetyltransferase